MKKKETICVHPPQLNPEPSHGVTSAIFPSTAYDYSQELIYPGFSSTYNQKRLGEIIAVLESAAWGIAFNSGMSAITTAILSLIKAGDHVIFFNELYGGAWKFANEELPQRGVSCSFANKSLSSFESCLQKNTRLVYLESPSNPLLSILDLEAIALWAKKNRIITIIDNTFATPINQLPVNLGIDISIHSGTKYLGGHNDLPFGAVVGTDSELEKKILRTSKLYGGSLTPYSCYLAERSIKTLSLRVERQNENAMKVGQFLESHSKVRKVYYPGLVSHEDHEVARRQMSGYGGMLSFELVSGSDVAGFLSRLSVIKPALSLGGVESLICAPSVTSHVTLSNKERELMGISDSLLRLSVGIENSGDLIQDLELALSRL